MDITEAALFLLSGYCITLLKDDFFPVSFTSLHIIEISCYFGREEKFYFLILLYQRKHKCCARLLFSSCFQFERREKEMFVRSDGIIAQI
jgi:hypothetical protein